MEQGLISKKNLAEVYKKWIDDCATENMKTECGVIEDCLCELYAQEVIDPVHAAGACYCSECKHARNWPNGLCYKNTEPCDNAKGYKGEAVCVNKTDFCSYGEMKQGKFHETKAAAKEMRQKKIASLRKQIERLERMEF